jgi:SAM-dependent methyltransferase
MDHNISLRSTNCAICGTPDNANVIYPANFLLEDFTPKIFSARRLPDVIHYRIVRCKNCGLVRSDPIINLETLTDLYTKSVQTYDDEVRNLEKTYIKYLDKAVKVLSTTTTKGHLLEIGCGSGFFLEQALEYGFERISGVEPSTQAVEKSAPNIKPYLICDILRPGFLPANQYSMICMFQVFDHIEAPGILLDECMKILKPGGGILILNHDVRALSAWIMGERSPIIDIEHTYLYDKNTIVKIVSQHGFNVIKVGSTTNYVSIRYLFHLLPLPKKMKLSIISFLQKRAAGKITIPIQLGNLFLVAQKPLREN